MFTFPISFFSGAASKPITTFIEGDYSSSFTTSFNYTVTDFGGIAPEPKRVVVVCFSGRIAPNISSVTIAGISGTIITSIHHSTAGHSGMAYAVVPTGTSSFTVNVTYTGNAQGAAITTYVLSGLSDTAPVQFNSTNSTTANITTTADNSAVITHAFRGGGTAMTWSGTLGLPSASDYSVAPFGDTNHGSNHIDLDTIQTSKTIIMNGSDRTGQHYAEWN